MAVHRQLGLSLVELLIAVALGSVVLIALVELLISNQQSYSVQQSMSRLHENARIALQLLSYEIQGAGYQGCVKANANTAIKMGEEIVVENDQISIAKMSVVTADLLQDMKQPDQLSIAAIPGLKVGDVMIVSDCQHSESFTLKKLRKLKDGYVLTTDKHLSKLYHNAAQVAEYQHDSYFVKSTKRNDEYGNEITSLYKKDIKNKKPQNNFITTLH